MTEEYDQITAQHYAAFRPSLHRPILRDFFGEAMKCQKGLDVGSGTGHSTIALAKYCYEVIGIEPSLEMLHHSLIHDSVSYQHFNGTFIDLPDDVFDVVTFAGSLYYAKSQGLLDEVVRVSRQDAKILIYDFDICLEEVWSILEVDGSISHESNYNHHEDFSGLIQRSIIREIEPKEEPRSIEVDLTDLTHLLLSAKSTYLALLKSFGYDNLYQEVLSNFQSHLASDHITLQAMTYATMYTVVK